MPTATDLVTDLPADFEVFGQAVATSMGDLLGGTSGQVLAKNSNTDMDFVWVTSDDANAIQNTIVDAKGDLIAASAADTPARLAVGNNGETLVCDSTTSTGLRYTAGNPIPNPTLNSAMQIWQRSTSIALAASTGFASGFTADRWQTQTGANQACTISRQATGDTTNLPFIQYALRYQRNSGQTGTGGLTIAQNFETINSIPFAGKTITLSFYARKGANYSATSSILAVALNQGTGTDQNVFSGFTGGSLVISQNATLTTTWQRFSYTATVPTTSTQLGLYFDFNPTGTAGAADYYDLTGVQIDIGSVALPFRTNGTTYAAELAACQRYFWREYGAPNSPAIAVSYTANSATIAANNPVTMRVAPSFTSDYQNANYGSTWALNQPTRAAAAKTGAVSNNYFTTPNTWAVCFDGGTFVPTPTAFQGSASSYFQASAEL